MPATQEKFYGLSKQKFANLAAGTKKFKKFFVSLPVPRIFLSRNAFAEEGDNLCRTAVRRGFSPIWPAVSRENGYCGQSGLE